MNRKLIALLGVSILTLGSASSHSMAVAADTASTTQGKENHREALERFKAALEQLNLTAPQKENIQSIFAEARSKLQALKGETDAKTQAREILQQARKDILAVLNSAQRAKLIEILKNDRSQSKT